MKFSHQRLYRAGVATRLKLFLPASFLAIFTSAAADARHLSEADVIALEKQCVAAEAPIFDRLRQKFLAECQELERNNRGDPAICIKRVKDVRPGGPIRLSPPLPICEQAFKAREHFGLYPR